MKRYHFIAIGGSAMHSLAIALKENGDQISGSDDAIFDPSKTQLLKAAIYPEKMGWYPEKISTDLDAVILGMHAKADNPELITAQSLGLKIYSYPEFIAHFSKRKTRVVIAGSHGKTTISAMVLHVLKYHDRSVDFMLGAQLDGYNNSVSLTDKNDFILLEGDEYLSSPIDLTPKFHHYKPQISLISGIAWDHVNVFKTAADYNKQFEIFINSITPGGVLIYNEEDITLSTMVNLSQNTIRKESYHTAPHFIDSGRTYLKSDEGALPLKVFGDHNLSNLAGAKWICQLMGVEQDDFYQAIACFGGAAKRLEKIVSSSKSFLFQDFAHAPSKVKATINAVKKQFENFKLFTCLELHTYSSLDYKFIHNYRDSLSLSDFPIVFYDPKTVKRKNLSPITKKEIMVAFNDNRIKIFTQPKALEEFLLKINYNKTVLLMMSSGNYGDISWEALKERVTENN